MKLQTPPRSTNFYESFSDLIFATMAIFVLVIIVLIIQIKPNSENLESKVEEFKKQIENLEKEISDVQKQNEEKTKKVSDLQKEMKEAVEKEQMELVVIVDGSGSMGTPLSELKKAIRALAEAIPLVTTEFKLGMIIYRNELDPFPMRRIQALSKDGGDSFRKVVDFTDNMTPESSPVYLENAIVEALSMFESDESRKSLMILGDIGPYESVQQGKYHWSCSEVRKENQIYKHLENFFNRQDSFEIFTFYA